MNYGQHPGWIEVISGVMFSGKSEELIRRVRRAIIARRRVQVFKSHLDARYAGLYSVSSHDGTELEATPVDSAAEIFRLVRPGVQLVAIDEAQFLDPDIVSVATLLASRGVRVILAGADTDFRGEPFGSMGDLMAVAEMVVKLQAICVVCGDPASTRPPSWSAAGRATRPGAATATRCRARTRTRPGCCSVRAARISQPPGRYTC